MLSPFTAMGRSPRILVVDDEAALRELARRALERDDYEVMVASSGPQALELMTGDAPIALVVADVQMPELTGDEMVRRLRAAQPDLKVLYVTGHIDKVMDARPLWEGEAFLEKPFTADGLREAVALLLYGTLKKPT
jgi:two-component system, cell cycle sensor histidine kinase and response regulator CckA